MILPKGLDKNTNQLVFRFAYSIGDIKVFQSLDTNFVGDAQTFYAMPVTGKRGKHIITDVDEFDNEMKRFIEITE